jgi:hypothetical protein
MNLFWFTFFCLSLAQCENSTVALCGAELVKLATNNTRCIAACTANDITVRSVFSPDAPRFCVSGLLYPITLSLVLVSTAQIRYSVTLIVGFSGGSAWLGGGCVAQLSCPPVYDANGDGCGDLPQSADTTFSATGSYLCNDVNGDGSADISFGILWINNGNDRCQFKSVIFALQNLFPSRCNLGNKAIPNVTVRENICEAGAFFSTESGLCEPCQAGAFSGVRALLCLPCTPGSFSSGNASACLPCPEGTYSAALGASTCIPCSPGQWNNKTGSASASDCVPCPVLGQSSPFGAVNASMCVCPQHSEVDNGQCSCSLGYGYDTVSRTCLACDAFSFKAVVGNVACLRCPLLSVVAQANLPAKNRSTCICPAFSAIDGSGALCECSAGYFLVGQTCFPCDAVSFKPTSGNVECTACPVHGAVPQVAQPGNSSTSCKCPSNSTLDVVNKICMCDRGYEWSSSSGICLECADNAYKEILGDGPCLVCPLFSAIPVGLRPGRNVSDCSCTGSNFVKVSNACQCDKGYFLNTTICVACLPMSYKDFVGSAPCAACATHASVASPPGKAEADCACPLNSALNVGINFCECNPGYEWTGTACTPCPAAFWKSSRGDGPCSSCPSGAVVQVGFQPGNSSLQCVCESANFVTVGNECQCNLGYYLNVSNCLPCSPSSFKASVGNSACGACPTHGVVPALKQPGKVIDNCECPANSVLDAVNSICLCDQGYEWNATTSRCTACKANAYKSLPGDGPCATCGGLAAIPSNLRPGVSLSQCACVGDHQTGPSCFCDNGYYFSNTSAACLACSAIEYKNSVGNDPDCKLCPTHASVPAVSQPGTLYSACQCPANSNLDAVNNICNCAPGYQWNGVAATCNPCPLNQYKGTPGDGPCITCPGNSQVPLAVQPGRNESDCKCVGLGKVAAGGACVCDFGFAVDLGGLSCTQCSKFNYKDTQSDSPCLPCPTLSSVVNPPGTTISDCICPLNSVVVALGGTNGTSCLCAPGYGYDVNNPSIPCVACDSAHYKAVPNNFPCDACPENSLVVSGVAATSDSSCQCQNRYKKNAICVNCISQGGNCTSGQLFAANGFWRPNTTYEEFRACIPLKACKGGYDDRRSNATKRAIIAEGCNSGYNSFMCAYCDPGYAWSGSECVTCNGPNYGLIIGIILLSFAFVGYVYWTVGAETIAKLAIFVNFLQLLAQSYFVQLVKFLPLAEFNWITVAQASGSCIFPFSWWQLWLFTMMIPWMMLAMVGVFFAGRVVYQAIHRARKHPERKCHVPEGKKPVPINSVQAGIMLVLFNYLLIAKTCLVMFACVSVFGTSVTAQNYSFVCGSSLHAALIAMAVIWLTLFCVLVPLVILLRIVIPNRLPWWLLLVDVEFLTMPFKQQFKWWEIVFTARRLAFAVIVTIVSVEPRLKVLIFALFALSFLVTHLWCQPYASFVDNLLEFAGLTAIVITFSVESFVLAYGDPDNAGLIFVVVLNALVLAAMLTFLLIDGVPMVLGKIRTCRDKCRDKKNKKQRKETTFEESGNYNETTLKALSSLDNHDRDDDSKHWDRQFRSNSVDIPGNVDGIEMGAKRKEKV